MKMHRNRCSDAQIRLPFGVRETIVLENDGKENLCRFGPAASKSLLNMI